VITSITSDYAKLSVRIDTSEIEAIGHRLGAAANRTDDALRRAINRTGDMAFTLVKREVARQMGIRVGKAADQMRRRRANYGSLTYSIEGRGGFIPLKEFEARKTRKGVSARPWLLRHQFPHTFFVAKLGGNVFKRVGDKVEVLRGPHAGKMRQPIEKLWGPALPREMVRGATAAAFERVVAEVLPRRVEIEVGRILRGEASG